MSVQMTGLCGKGTALIWKQCNDELFAEGLHLLEEAAFAGDAQAWFFLGRCYSWGDGAVGFSEKKARECYEKGTEAGSARAVLGAIRAGQFDEEMRARSLLTPEESFRELKEAAMEGDAFAAWQLAEAFEWENLSEVLPEEERRRELCFSWYRKAAEGGIVPAMVKMGKCFQRGQYVSPDRGRFLEWADRAAAQGDVWGLYQMGLYHQEQGHADAAFQYFAAASYQGDAKAPLLLGRMYLSGEEGVPRDVKRAVESFELAASRDEPESLAELGHIFYRDEVVERDDEKALYWYKRAYAAGQKSAALPLAHLVMRGADLAAYQQAHKLLLEAAEEETDGQAALALGNLYRDGLLGVPDMEQALEWYEKGAKQENPECMELLGCLYFQGEEGVETDYQKAFYWLSRCLEAGTLQSCSKLAYLYMKGEGCEENEEMAIRLFERAAQSEYDGYALYELGFLYERRGSAQGGSPEDLDQAADYYQRAIEMGNESAVRRFSHFKKSLFGRWKITY